MSSDNANTYISGGVNYGTVVGQINAPDTQSDEQAIIQWLAPLNHAQKQSDVFKVHQSGTGRWFTSSPVFDEWLASDRKALWAHGIQGAGKTVLMSMLVSHLNELDSKEPANRVACVYCEYSQTALQSPENLLASIWRQLLPDQDALPPNVRNLWEGNKRGSTRASTEQVMSVLSEKVAKLSVVSILIDAVDELRPKVQKDLLQNIRSLLAMPELKGTRIRLMFSSRQEKSLFTDADLVEIVAADEDVKLFVEKCIKDGISPASDDLSDLVRNDLDLKKTIISGVTKQSKGMFLLTRLYMDLLEDQVSLKKIRNAIEHLPQGLDAVYEEAWKRIQQQTPGHSDLAQQVIQWLSSAFTQMTVNQLRHAMATEVDDSDVNEENMPAADILAAACQGLVKIDRGSGIIRLAHFTTYEFFRRVRSEEASDAHLAMAKTCLTYLMFKVFDRGPCKPISSRLVDMQGARGEVDSRDILARRIFQYPFMKYAANHWGDHARLSAETDIQASISAFLRQPRCLASTIQARYVDSEFGYDAELDAQHPGSLALHAAVCYELEVTVNLLLRDLSEWEINGVDCRGKTALHWAVESKSTSIALKLLQAGADLESDVRAERFQWFAVSFGTGLDRCEWRSRMGRDFDQQSPEMVVKGDLVYLCVESEQMEILRSYLLNAVDDLMRTARATNVLFKASLLDRPKIVNLAIDMGGAINKRDTQGRTPLMVAVDRSHVNTVQILLQHGASTDIEYGRSAGRTLIQAAVEDQHAFDERLTLIREVFDRWTQPRLGHSNDTVHKRLHALLVQGGILPLSRSRKSHRLFLGALHEDRSQKRIIAALLSHGVRSSVRTGNGETLLHLAVGSAGRLGVLLEGSMSNSTGYLTSAVNLGDLEGRTALHHAAAAGNPHAMLVLLSHGADINARDKGGATPLHFAVETFECVLIALRAGAVVHATDKLGRNTLHYQSMVADDPDPKDPTSWQKPMLVPDNPVAMRNNPNFSPIPRNYDAETFKLIIKAFEQADAECNYPDVYGFTSSDYCLSTRGAQQGFEETISWLKLMKKRYLLRTAAVEAALAHLIKQAKEAKQTWTVDANQLVGQGNWSIKSDGSTEEVLEPGRPLAGRSLTFDGKAPDVLDSRHILLIPS